MPNWHILIIEKQALLDKYKRQRCGQTYIIELPPKAPFLFDCSFVIFNNSLQSTFVKANSFFE